MLQTNMKIISQQEIAANIYELVLRGENTQQMKPGQFLMIKPKRADLLLRRPISIASYDKVKATCTLLYRSEGSGTRNLSELNAGEYVDVVGPLGNGFTVSDHLSGKPVLLIGGGIGVPPLYQLGKELSEMGALVTFVNGFSSAKDVFYVDKMKVYGTVHIATIDGTTGVKGLVTDITATLKNQPAAIFSCGPRMMLRAVKAEFPASQTYLSLEERMACGIGACYACVCDKEEGGQFKVCSDGPVFRADEVKL